MNEILNINLINKYINDYRFTECEFCSLCKISNDDFNALMSGADFNIISLFKIAKQIEAPIYRLFK